MSSFYNKFFLRIYNILLLFFIIFIQNCSNEQDSTCKCSLPPYSDYYVKEVCCSKNYETSFSTTINENETLFMLLCSKELNSIPLLLNATLSLKNNFSLEKASSWATEVVLNDYENPLDNIQNNSNLKTNETSFIHNEAYTIPFEDLNLQIPIKLAPLKPPSADEEDFNVIIDLDNYTLGTTRAKKVHTGIYSYVYVDINVTEYIKNIAIQISDTFDAKILPTIVNTFGDYCKPPNDIDNDPKIYLVFTNAFINDYVLGYFYPADTYQRDIYAYSNLKEVLFINAWAIENNYLEQLKSTVTHEFTHLVHFCQRKSFTPFGKYSLFEEKWLVEGIAQLGENLCGYGIHNSNSIAVKELNWFLELLKDTPVPLIVSDVATPIYPLEMLFATFIYEQYPQSIKKIITNKNRGIKNIENSTGKHFKDIFINFVSALYSDNNSSDDKYKFKIIDFNKTMDGVKLNNVKPLYSVSKYPFNLNKTFTGWNNHPWDPYGSWFFGVFQFSGNGEFSLNNRPFIKFAPMIAYWKN